MRVTFYKRNFTELVVEIAAEEPTTIVLAEYFENYFGHEGLLTLRHTETKRTFSIALYQIGHNLFEGTYPLESLPLGLYRLEGRVRDVMHNYAVLSDFYEDTGLPNQMLEMVLGQGYEVVPVISANASYNIQLDSRGSYDMIIEGHGSYNHLLEAKGAYNMNFAAKGRYNLYMEIPCE